LRRPSKEEDFGIRAQTLRRGKRLGDPSLSKISYYTEEVRGPKKKKKDPSIGRASRRRESNQHGGDESIHEKEDQLQQEERGGHRNETAHRNLEEKMVNYRTNIRLPEQVDGGGDVGGRDVMTVMRMGGQKYHPK